MRTTYAVTKAIKETVHRIAVLLITESSAVRTMTGSLGSTFADLEPCTREEFISCVPDNTEEDVMDLPPGTYTFDAEQGRWNAVAETP